MPMWSPRIRILWLVFCLALPLAGRTEEVTPADSKGVRAVVEAQLAAFAADDADKAFSYAAPNIRELFGTAENFIAMVRKGYPMVYRPASVAFLTPAFEDGDLVQKVQIADAEGKSWLAVYRLQRQADKSWRITSCQVANSQGRFV